MRKEAGDHFEVSGGVTLPLESVSEKLSMQKIYLQDGLVIVTPVFNLLPLLAYKGRF